MVSESAFADEFSGTADFDTFCSTFMRFELWHKFSFGIKLIVEVRSGNRGSRKLLLPNPNREVTSAKLRLALHDGIFAEELDDSIK